MPRVLALMDSMWQGYTGRGPRWFRINPCNFSGRRLYGLVGKNVTLWVTNCCPEMQVSAKHHGAPDLEWVRENLAQVTPDLLLVCGAVAQRTYALLNPKLSCRAVLMKHPAARDWTKQELETMRRKISVQLQSTKRKRGLAKGPGALT